MSNEEEEGELNVTEGAAEDSVEEEEEVGF